MVKQPASVREFRNNRRGNGLGLLEWRVFGTQGPHDQAANVGASGQGVVLRWLRWRCPFHRIGAKGFEVRRRAASREKVRRVLDGLAAGVRQLDHLDARGHALQFGGHVCRMFPARRILVRHDYHGNAFESRAILSPPLAGPADVARCTKAVFHKGKNILFPFSRGTAGVEQFNAEYTEKIIVESENSSYAKPVPFIKKPRQWWEWKASKTHFRAYSDPRVIAGMLKAGLVIPTFKTIPVELLPGPKQGLTLVASIDQFNKIFDEYNADLKAKAKQNEKVYLLNSSQILSRMNLMRYAATIPGLLNDKLAAIGKPSVYDGPYGGVKMEHVKTLVKQKTDAGGKVVI